MRIHLAVLRVILFVVLAKWCSFAEAQKIVKRVVIHSSAGGLGGGSNTLVVIQRKGGKFLSDGRLVSAVQVQSLVDALSAAPLTKLDTTNLGITNEWLASKVESQWSSVRARATEMTASQEKLFKKSFTNPNLVADVLPSLFLSIVFDLFLYCKVELVFDDGSKLSAESYSYAVFMLPWSMKGRGFTWNADISRAIAALLPAQSVNKETLAGDELASDLAYLVMASIERERDLQERAGEAPEPGWEKVALYAAADGTPTHAARQLSGGRWSSKFGRAQDVEHALRALEGADYGTVVRILRRQVALG